MNWVKNLVVVSKALISCIFDDQSCLMMLNHLIANSCISQGRAIFSLKPIKRLGSQSFSGLDGIQKYRNIKCHVLKVCSSLQQKQGFGIGNWNQLDCKFMHQSGSLTFLSETHQKTWFTVLFRFSWNSKIFIRNVSKFCGLQLHNFLSETHQKIQRFRDNLRLSLNLKNTLGPCIMQFLGLEKFSRYVNINCKFNLVGISQQVNFY